MELNRNKKLKWQDPLIFYSPQISLKISIVPNLLTQV